MGTAAAAPTRAANAPACPGPGAAVQERFFSAECADCWAGSEASLAATPAPSARSRPNIKNQPAFASAWLFDWITPAGDAAPLALGALPESAERAARLGLTALPPAATHRQDLAALPPRSLGATIKLESGPAWQGYFGLQLTLSSPRRWQPPAGASAWLALVEIVPAGRDGTPVKRALVRSVAGPLPLSALTAHRSSSHLRALRWPAAAEPANLQGRAWIEGPDGQILAVTADQCR